MINYLVPFILFLLSQVSLQVGFIQPVTPLGAAFVNTELPSIYTFDFTLTSGLREDGSLRIKFPNYTTLGTPTCFLDVNNVTWNASCQAIDTSVYIQPYMELSPDEEVRATVFVTQPVPDLPGYTELFEVSSVSSTDETTAIIFDINPGFGNFVWQPFSTIGRLFVEQLRIGTNATANLQGATNDIEVHIRFNKGFTAKYSRVLVLLDMPWTFGNVTITTDRSPMYSVAVAQGLPIDLYLPAGVQSFNTINQQLLQIYFNETFAAGREFIMTISGIINPMSITTGNIRFFSTDFTGSYVLEANQDIQLFTSENNLDITIGLASGIPLQGPARLYRNTEQYISISFPIDATIDAGSTITYNFSQDSVPVTGTLYISPSLQGLNGTEVIYNYTSNGLILSNLDALAVGSEVYVQVKVLFSKIRPQFFVNVTVTSSENITVKHGESQPIDLTTNANSIVTFFGDSNNEPNVIQTSQSLQLYLNLSTTAKIVDGSNSVLTIYSNNLIFGDSQLNCTSDSGITFSSCTFTQTSTYSMIVIKPIPGPTTVDMIISGLEITTVSNHENAIYEFYMRLDKDGNGVEYQDLMVFAFVRPQRNVLSSFIQSHIGNIQGNTMDTFPSFLRMFGSQTSLSSIRVRTNQDFILTIYGFNALNNLLEIPDNEPFPCGSNLNIVCNFIQGSPYAVSSYPLDWDRVIITLPEEALNTPFNIYIPQFFDNSANQTYEFMIGTYDKTTLMYNNLQLQDTYVIVPDQDTTFFTSNNATTGLNMDLSNQKAGIMVTSSIPISFATQVNPAIPAGQVSYGAATVLVTTWGFWNNQSALANPTTPISTAAEDATVFLSYPTQSDGNMYAVIWPMTTDTQTQNYSLTFQSTYVEMPYSLDIPDYVMYVTDPNGDLYFYNQVINTGRNALSSNKITNFTFDCLDMVQNYLNTYCTIQFTPNAEIDLQTKVKVEFSNAFVTISECSISYTTDNGTVVALDSSTFACDSSLGEIRLAFDLPERLPVAYYNFSFLGLDFLNGSSNGMNFTIYDSDYGYIIEQASIDYYLELQLLEMISLDNLNYQYLNLDSISNLGIQFTLPRDMNTNEVLEFDVGADIQGNNVDTNRLALFLVNADTPDQRINIYGALKNQILQLQFDTGVYLPEGSYILNIDNLRTPTTQLTDKVKIRLRRLTDSVFVLENNYTLFTAYPVLFLGNSAQIELLSSRFLCVGCLGEFVFQVTLTSTYVDATTMLYLHFPSFFLPALTNEAAQLDCSFNTDPVNCYTDSDYPFRLDITGSPLNLKPGDIFNLTIYGIVIPNADEVNSNEEYIFFAISTAQNLSVYSEQTFLGLPDLSLIRSGFDPMFFYNLTVSNNTIKVASDHILRVNTSADIPVGSKITVTLTDDYTNLRYSQSLSCGLDLFILGVRSQNYSKTVCPVTGNTIEFDIIKDIPGGYSLELTIHSVPNPPQVVTVDPTEFLIVAFEDDENDIIAISRDSLNSVYLVDFIDPENILQANNNQDIVVTRGTYTQEMTIGTVPGQRFKQDVSITANTTGFTFVPMDLNFYVGDTTSTFRLGCDENVKLRTYPLEFTQNQNTSLVNMYGDLFNVRITVTDTPITIGIPDYIIVPINGYSLPYTILLDQPPFKSMQILIDYDEDLLDGVFGIDEDYSSPDLNFTLDNGIGYFAFYAKTGVPTQPFNVTLELDGDNYESYQLNRSTIEIRPQSVTIGPAIVTGSTVQIGKTLAVFSITPATEGMLFYQLSEPCIGAQSLSDIKNLMKNNSFNELEVTQGCYQRYSVQPVDSSEIPVILNVTSLTPETTYNLYVYFENGLKQNNMANILSFTFTTAAMNPIIKMDATFSQRIFIDQLNDFICFLLILFETRAVNVVDAQGYSCSSFVEPTSRFLTFQGESFSNYSYGFSFYLLPDPTVEIDASSLVVPEYFDSTNHANTAFYQAAQNAGINFLQSYSIETSFTQEQAFASTGPVVMPTLEGFNEQVSVVELNGTITMANIQLSQPGTVYAFARAIGSIVQDPEDDFAMIDVTTRIPKTPTFDQINNCLDWNNEPADACAKAVLVNADQNIDLQLQGLTPNTAYIVYYAVANEYPIAPIFSSDIESFTIQVLNANLISYCSTLLIALMLFLLL